MAFRASDGSFLGEWYAREQEEFYSHVPVWVAVGAVACEAAGRYLTHAEYHGLIELLDGMNSYTRKVLLPVLDDLAVCELASYCMSQSGRALGDLDIPRHYNEAVEKELAPLLVKRLRVASAGWLRLDGHFEKVREALKPTQEDERLPVLDLAKKRSEQLEQATGLLQLTRKYAEEWGQWREAIEHLKKTAAGQQKRADKLNGEFLLLQKDWLAAIDTRDTALREAAAWEVQCQDLRDRVVQAEAESARRYDCHGGPGTTEPACGGCVSCLLRALEQATQDLAAQQKMGGKLADYLDTATGIIEEDAVGDEDDIRDARELIAEARALFTEKQS